MPKGVDHSTVTMVAIALLTVQKSLMPKGVDHSKALITLRNRF
jgi:hypothetical protein